MSQELTRYQEFPRLGGQQIQGFTVFHYEDDGTLFYDPTTYRTYRVLLDGSWEDVSLLYPVNDIEDYRIRQQNMYRGTSNYMPKRLELPEVTEDIDYEEVPPTLLP